MSRIFKLINERNPERRLKPGLVPLSISYNPGKMPLILFENGNTSVGSCIRCKFPKCYEFIESDIILDKLTNFPAYSIKYICPSKSISMNSEGMPEIDDNTCIKCGICVRRCPVGAMYFDHEGLIRINSESDVFEFSGNSSSQSDKFNKVKKIGRIFNVNDNNIKKIVSLLKQSYKNYNSYYPNILVNNLLNILGVKTVIRRKGDVNVRMDGIVFVDNSIGALEIDILNNSILDEPRNILDDIAVICSRYKISKQQLFGLIIANELPNKRTEYWSVIQDFKKILNINIYTLTIPVLILLNWNFKNLNPRLYQMNEKSNSIRKQVENDLGYKIQLKEGLFSIIESSK